MKTDRLYVLRQRAHDLSVRRVDEVEEVLEVGGVVVDVARAVLEVQVVDLRE